MKKLVSSHSRLGVALWRYAKSFPEYNAIRHISDVEEIMGPRLRADHGITLTWEKLARGSTLFEYNIYLEFDTDEQEVAFILEWHQ